MKRLISWRGLAALMACAALPVAAVAADWKFSTSVQADSGKYGTSERTDSVYIPFTLKRYYTGYDLSVTVPYLSLSSTGDVTWVDGKPVRGTRGTGGAGSARSGLGDVMLRGGYTLREEEANSYGLALAAKLKLPTADEDEGLGTGEADIGAGLEFSKLVSPGWTLLADGYYTLIGEPTGAEFNNQLALDTGFYRQLRGGLGLTVLFETQTAIVDGNDDPRSLGVTLSYDPAPGTQLTAGLTLGLSDGSPDTGLSAGFSRRF
ncbi:MAG: transporter [Elusimicrobiales bacterium]|nr:transporter [Elusimicrobiales bacterium]